MKKRAVGILGRLTSRFATGASEDDRQATARVDPSIGASLNGLRVLITGGSSGIGEAVASSLLQARAKVIIVGRSEGTVSRAVQRLGGTEDRVTGLWGDLTDAASLEGVLAAAWERRDGIDALVNSIGEYAEKDPCQISREEWQRCLDTNLSVPFFASTWLARKLLDREQRGTIVNIGSCVGIKPAPSAVPYGMAKAALAHMTRSLARKWGRHGIRVNTVSPGITMTRMNAHLERDPALRKEVAKSTALRRLAAPQEIAAAVLFLLSPQSSYVTGAELVVDGGFVIC